MRQFCHSVAVGLVALSFAQRPQAPGLCPQEVGTTRAGRVVNVSKVDALEDAVRSARSGDTILVADGDYALHSMLDVSAPNVTIRGRGGDPSKVVLHGRGMLHDPVGVGISVSARGVTVADLTVRDVGFHAVQVRGERGASGFTLRNARLQDAGQQLLKGSVSDNHQYADDGVVACSEFSYTSSAPTAYTGGVDILAAKGWVIRDNRFVRIRGPESGHWSGGPAILAWVTSEDTVVERNVIVDSFRGIALGLEAGASGYSRTSDRGYDHLRGLVRNNVVVNLNAWADEAIEANGARNVRIEHNTVLVESAASPWSIGVRFSSASATVRNNLTNRRILERDGGRAVMEGNVMGATRAWFIDPTRADLHLSQEARRAIDAGVIIPDLPEDFDRGPRIAGQAPDAGAFEVRSDRGRPIR